MDSDVNFNNFKSLKIHARKLLVGTSSSAQTYRVVLKTIAKARSDWFLDTAPEPDLGIHGNDGEDGAPGLPSATVHIETGCITGLVLKMTYPKNIKPVTVDTYKSLQKSFENRNDL